MINDHDYGDLTIKCKGEEWRCHRAVLCPRCPFFEAACKHLCKVGRIPKENDQSLIDHQESESRVIELDDDEPVAVRVMLEYLYTSGSLTLRIKDFDAAAATFIVADKYSLARLRSRSKENMIRRAEQQDDSANDVAVTKWAMPIGGFWQSTIEGSEEIRQAILKGYKSSVKRPMLNREMEDLLSSNEEFGTQLIEFLAESES